MNLIDKDALVAEIDVLENRYQKCPTRNTYEDGLKDGRLIGYKDTLYKINTLEVIEEDETLIEKACEWIVRNMDDYIYVVYDTATGMPTNEAHIADKKVVEDFIEYMKRG